eukprot:1925382-Pyramimonas_sp.AAC.1
MLNGPARPETYGVGCDRELCRPCQRPRPREPGGDERRSARGAIAANRATQGNESNVQQNHKPLCCTPECTGAGCLVGCACAEPRRHQPAQADQLAHRPPRRPPGVVGEPPPSKPCAQAPFHAVFVLRDQALGHPSLRALLEALVRRTCERPDNSPSQG